MNQNVTVNLNSPANTVCANKDRNKVAVAGRKSININNNNNNIIIVEEKWLWSFYFFPFSFHYLWHYWSTEGGHQFEEFTAKAT